MAIVFSNNARTTLASGISSSATSITVTDGSVFPSLTGNDIFYCTIDDGTNNEIVKVTAISSNTLTVVRAQDNTTANAFVTGDLIELRLVAAVLDTFSQLDAGEVTADEFIGDLRGAVIFKAQAGEAVSKGDAVYVSGISGTTPIVALADADFASKMPAFGLVLTTASLNGSTEVVTFGTISGVDTSAFSLGDTLYVSTTAGALTNSKPTGESSLIQNIGKVQRSHASAGSIKVGGAGRSNDTPNLNDGNIFIGNASNQATTASLNTKIEDYLDANGITFPDNVKAQFGTSSDLKIYHNGSNSYIDDAGTGNLFIRSNEIRLNKYSGEFMITAIADGAVTLYHDNSPKLATTSTGIDVTGTATMDGLTVDGDAIIQDATPTLEFKDTDNNLIASVGGASGSLVLKADTGGGTSGESMQFHTGGVIRQNISAGGDISFYEDTGTTAKFFWDASAERLGIATTAPNATLHVNGGVHFGPDSGVLNPTTGEVLIETVSGSTPTLKMYPYGASVFQVKSDGTAATIGWGSSVDREVNILNTGTGGIKVGIGTDTPGANLHIGGQEASPGGTAGTVDRLHIQPYSNTGGPYKFIARTVSGSSDFLDMYYGPNHIISYGLDGKIGISTSSPNGKLDVASAQNTTNQFTSPHLRLRAISTTNSTGFTGIAYSTSTLDNYGWTVGALRDTTGNNSDFVFNLHNNSASGSEKMRIDGATGNATFNGTISSGAIISSGKLEINQAGNGTSNAPSGVAEFSGASYGGVVKALSLVNSVTAALGNGTQLAFHNASNYSPTGTITVTQAGDTTTDSKMEFQIYRGSLQTSLTIDHDSNATFAGSVYVGSATTNGGVINLIQSSTNPEIRIQGGESGASLFSIYNAATDPDAEQFFINNTLSSSHLGNKRGALKLESSSGVVLTLGGTTATFAGTINSGAIASTGEVEATALDINGDGDISGNLTLGGYLAGPATFTIDPAAVGNNTGTVVIAGNLQVDGTTTTINSTTLTVDDKLITLASGSLNAAAADGAGIEVEISGATNPSLTYDGTNDEWDFNKNVTTTGHYIADTHFRSSDSNATLSATGGGGVYLRPDGNSNSANQAFIASGTGNATFSGTINSGAITSTGTSTFGTGIIVNTANNTVNTTQPSFRKGSSGEAFIDAAGHIVLNIDTNNNNTDRYFGVSANAAYTSPVFKVFETGQVHLLGSSTSIRADGPISFNATTGAAQAGLFKSVAAQTSYANSASDGMFNALNGYAVGTGTGTTVIDSAGNLTNIGTINSGAITATSTITYTPDVGGDLTLGNDGSYGTHTNGRYLTLGFGGTTNGYNRIFAGNTADANLFIASATGRGIYFRTNGGSADSVIIDTTAGIRSRGQVRATGWYGTQSSDNNGLAAEIGVSGTTAYLLSYNRSSSAYGALRLAAAGITLEPRGSALTITNSSYVQSDSDIRAAGQKVRIGNPTGLSGRSSIRIDTTGDAAADLVFGDNTGSTGWSNVNWALSSRATNENQTFRIYRGSGQPSPYNSEAVAVEIARDLNMTLGKGLVLGSSSTLTIPSHAGFEIDITGSQPGNIRANSDLYLLSQTGVLRLGAGGTNSQISLATNGNATFSGLADFDSGITVSVSGSDRLSITGGDVDVVGTTDLRITGASRRLSFTSGTGTVRTTTANSLILQTNSTPALTLDSSQNATFAGTVDTPKVNTNELVRSNSRVDSAEDYPVGHYSQGDMVFAIDPTWAQSELQAYFNSSNVSWSSDSTAPGGYSIYINGGVSVGGVYGSGFPYIPVETGDIFYMECWVKNAGSNQSHYLGSNEFNENFGNLGGNPGSFGYWVMAATDAGTGAWTKYSGYISNISPGNTVGEFEVGTKYWTPMALWNYTAGTGTRACYISGWKIYRVNRGAQWIIQSDSQSISSSRLGNSASNSYSGSVGSAWYPLSLVDNNNNPGHPLVIKNSRDDYWSVGLDTHSYGMRLKAHTNNTRSAFLAVNTSSVDMHDLGFDGDAYHAGNLGIGVAPDSAHSLKISSDDNEPLEIYGSSGGAWINIQSSGSLQWSMGADSTGWGLYDRSNSAYRMQYSSGNGLMIREKLRLGALVNPEFELDFGSGSISDATPTARHIRFPTYNGPGDNSGTTSSGGIKWESEYGGYTKESASIKGIAQGNYFRTGIGFFVGNDQNATTNATAKMVLHDTGQLSLNKGQDQTTLAAGGFGTPQVVMKQLANSTWGGVNIEANGNDSILAISTRDDYHIIAGSYRATGGYKDLAFSVGNQANVLRLKTDGDVCIGQSSATYSQNDNTRLVGSTTSNKLHVNGSIQLTSPNDAIVFGAATATFLTDEELGFGWGGGWYMTDGTYLRVRNNKHLYSTGASTFGSINNTGNYSQTGGTFSTAGASTVTLTDGFERVKINGYDLLGYSAGGNGLWVISNVTANASNETTLTLGTEWDWDDCISLKYVPAASGSTGGVLTIGQDQKNSTSWNHNTTNFNFSGSTIFQFGSASRFEMRPTSSSGGERVYYAAGSYTANYSATFQDVRMVGSIPVDHKYVRNSSGGYGYKQENWWDGNSYQSIRQENDAFRFSVDVIAFDTSDKRLKNNITPIENCLDKVSKLGAYEFEWDETKQRRFKGFDTGVIAQEVEEIYPHMIETREDGYKALQYEKLVPLLLGAIKEQQEQIESLKSEVNNLKGEK